MKTILEALQQIRKKIENREHWCQGSNALDIDKVGVEVTSEDACQWCINGAIYSTIGLSADQTHIKPFDFDRLLNETYAVVLNKAAQMFGKSHVEVNDLLGHEKVLELLDACIKDQEEKDGLIG